MGSRSPIDILLEDDNENKIKRRNTRIIYLWLYSTWLIVLSHIRLYAPRQSTSCLYMIHYGLSVALLFALLTVHIPLEFSSLYYIPITSSFASLTLLQVKYSLYLSSRQSSLKKESSTRFQTPLYQHPLFISFYWVLE